MNELVKGYMIYLYMFCAIVSMILIISGLFLIEPTNFGIYLLIAGIVLMFILVIIFSIKNCNCQRRRDINYISVPLTG